MGRRARASRPTIRAPEVSTQPGADALLEYDGARGDQRHAGTSVAALVGFVRPAAVVLPEVADVFELSAFGFRGEPVDHDEPRRSPTPRRR